MSATVLLFYLFYPHYKCGEIVEFKVNFGVQTPCSSLMLSYRAKIIIGQFDPNTGLKR